MVFSRVATMPVTAWQSVDGEEPAMRTYENQCSQESLALHSKKGVYTNYKLVIQFFRSAATRAAYGTNSSTGPTTRFLAQNRCKV